MADSTERDPLELLAAEYMDRLRRGQNPSLEKYAAQYPELAEAIRELFPTIAMTERLKARQARASGGRVTLGAVQLQRLGDYRIIREIGRGGMGVVFEAEQESLGRRVAVKVLPRQVLLEEKHLRRFQREARIAAGLHHTNIVEIFGVGEDEGFHYYVMQYIEGAGLDTLVPELIRLLHQPEADAATAASIAARHLLSVEDRQAGRLGPGYWQAVARIGLQAAEALSHAHRLGVLHRDIKPANLLLGHQGNVWLADFGLAKAAQSDDRTLSQDIAGTLRYMAPEQLQGRTDPRSDIYSLGLTLYELLALRPAHEETDQTRLIQRISQGPPPPPPSTAQPSVPRDLETIILKAIQPEAAQRYPSAEAMANDLRCFLEDRPILARRTSPAERLARWARRNPAVATLASLTLVLLLLVAAVAAAGYLRTKRALEGEAQERSKAQAIAQLAIAALDHTFERLYPERASMMPQPARETMPEETNGPPNPPILSKETAALLEEMLSFYDRLAGQTSQSESLRLRTAEANRRVGAIRQRLGQPAEAAQAYRRAIALYQELNSREAPRPDTLQKIAQIYNELGRLLTSQRQAAEARQEHLAALALLQPVAATPAAPAGLRFELARTCFFLGQPERPLPTAVPRRVEPAPSAEAGRNNLAKAVALLKALTAEAPANPEYVHLLALCYLEGARGDNRSDGRSGDERAIELLAGLVKSYPSVPDYAYDLSEAYTRMHIPRPPIPRETEVLIEERLGKALALLKPLAAKHPEAPDFLAFEARTHHKLGSFYQQTDRWQSAERSFREAVACQARLVDEFPQAPYYGLWMGTFRLALADTLLRRGQPGAARSELEPALAALEAQARQWPAMDSLHELLATGYSQLAQALRQLGESRLAAEAARKAEQERRPAQR